MKFKKNFLKNIGEDFRKIYSPIKMAEISVLLFCGAFLADCWNLPSRAIERVSLPAFIVICGVVAVIAIIKLCAAHFFELIKVESANPIDCSLCVISLSSGVYAITRGFLLGWQWYVWIAMGICAVSIALMFFRSTKRYHKLQSVETAKTELVDLKDLYEGRVKKSAESPILLRETDVEYDLLGRETIINQLYQSIVHCQSEESYVISLCGPWGIGKTTIINNVKRLLMESDAEFVIIDSFDPWLYGNQEALFGAMLDELLEKTGIRYKAYLTSKKINNIAKSITKENIAGNMAYNLLSGSSGFGNEVAAMKERLRSYIQMSAKKYVFFIDNLDRTSDANIIFLFKMISIVFDLPGIIYVLSYEKDRVNSIFREVNEYDARFTEKIIQQEISVPPLSEETTRNLLAVCTENALKAYGVSQQEMETFMPAAEYIFKKVKNVRDFKRMINTVFSAVFNPATLLDKRDLLSIELIRFYEPALYDEIRRNSRFFISHDLLELGSFWMGLHREQFNQEGKE